MSIVCLSQYCLWYQELLGHKDSKTTEIYPVRNICGFYLCYGILYYVFYKLSMISNAVYPHVSTKSLVKISSPLDGIDLKEVGDY
mgnify:CR=1